MESKKSDLLRLSSALTKAVPSMRTTNGGPMAKCFLILGAVSGFLSVALGAFAAHGLKEKLSAYHLSVFRTGVDYQFYHTFAIALVGIMLLLKSSKLFPWSGYFFIAGIIIFSGSLYLLAFTGQKFWGAITPIGGLCFLVGWAVLAYAFWTMSGSTT